MKVLNAFIKPFEAPQGSVKKKKKLSYFFSLCPGLGREGIIVLNDVITLFSLFFFLFFFFFSVFLRQPQRQMYRFLSKSLGKLDVNVEVWGRFNIDA